MTSNGWLFVSWIRFHGRSDDLARDLPARAEYITGGSGNRIVRYVRQWRETRRLLKQTGADVVFVMQPPVLALWAVIAAARKSTHVIADLHTGVFTDPKWSWAAKGTLRLLRKHSRAAIVTNESLASRCRSAGVDTYVLDDAVPRRVGTAKDLLQTDALKILSADEYVLVPLAYAADEPLDEILEAAATDAGRTWVFTGQAPDHVRRKASTNVLFSGFVSNDDYNWLAANAGAILACTTEEDTMQRAGYEAVSWERPLVTSKTGVLVDYFGEAAVFAAPTAASLLDATRAAFEDRDALIGRIAELGQRKREEYEGTLGGLRRAVMTVTSGTV